jgi:imidazolonepropionase-like amidohydrolase
MLKNLVIGVHLCLSVGYSDLLIRDVTIVEVSTGTVHPRHSILIRGERIAATGREIPVPKGVRVVEGAGKFVIPGLWDMHVHLADRDQLALYLARGVTGVRDMGSDLDRAKDWRRAIDKGELLGPHIETCGPPFDGFPSDDAKRPVTMVRSPGEARTVYDRLDDRSVDFIGERARKYYSPVAGAVPSTVSVLEAVDNRQRSIDQMSGILVACSSEERKLRGPRALAIDRRDWAEFQELEAKALKTFDDEKADALFYRMAMFETRAVPVLVKLRASQCTKDHYAKLAELVLAMDRAGVGIMAGAGDAQIQDEMELLVAAGLTPAEALRSATLEPAKYLDAAASLGTVEPGKIADLVLLDRNPLADIKNTREIAAVVFGGKYLSKVQLRALPQHH